MKKPNTLTLRRLLAMTLALVLVVGLTGCWFKEKPDPTEEPLPPVMNDPTPSTQPSTSAPTAESTQEPTDAPTEAPTEEPTEAPTEDTKPVQTTTMGTVTATKLNIRSAADSGASVVGSYFKNDRIELLEIKDGWGRTAKGWVNMAYVETDTNNTNTETDDEKDDDKTTNKDVVSDGKTQALGYGVVNLGSLNVRTGPSTDYEKVGTVSLGQRYAYYQKSGNWVRINKGWISVSYFYLEGTTGEGAGEGKITGSGLNIRSGPGTGFDSVGSYKKGDTVKILTQIDGWGYTGKGWVSMKYVEMDKTDTPASEGKGTVTADVLNIRKSASANADKVGKYYKGDKVEILEIKDGWGRTDKGWINMEYVEMDKEESTNTEYKTGEGTVTASKLNIREKADINSKSVGSYKKGDKVKITEVNGEWGKTSKGWINLKYVKMT